MKYVIASLILALVLWKFESFHKVPTLTHPVIEQGKGEAEKNLEELAASQAKLHTPQGREILKIKNDLSRKIKVLEQSSQVFSEGWKAMFGAEVQAPPSVFKILGKLLQAQHGHIDSNDLDLNSLTQTSDGFVYLAEVGACPQVAGVLKIQSAKSGERLTLSKRICQSQQILPVLEWNFLSKDKSTMRVWSANFQEGIGNALALVGKNVECHMDVDEKNRLQRLQCDGLGQNRHRMTHVLFHEFVYQRSLRELLTIRADQYQNLQDRVGCDLRDPCLTLKVPLEGQILVVENQIKQQKSSSPQGRGFAAAPGSQGGSFQHDPPSKNTDSQAPAVEEKSAATVVPAKLEPRYVQKAPTIQGSADPVVDQVAAGSTDWEHENNPEKNQAQNKQVKNQIDPQNGGQQEQGLSPQSEQQVGQDGIETQEQVNGSNREIGRQAGGSASGESGPSF